MSNLFIDFMTSPTGVYASTLFAVLAFLGLKAQKPRLFVDMIWSSIFTILVMSGLSRTMSSSYMFGISFPPLGFAQIIWMNVAIIIGCFSFNYFGKLSANERGGRQ